MQEQADYEVTLTLRLSTRITFSPKREGLITKADAIAAAIDSLPPGWIEKVEGEGFEVAFLDGEAFRNA